MTAIPPAPGRQAPNLQIPRELLPYERFIDALHRLTGLTTATIVTWVAAEHGPVTNPLGIQAGSHGMARFSSPEAAAQATAQLLKSNPAYHPILRAAADVNAGPAVELNAIIASPWDAKCHYRGSHPDGSCANAKPGSFLLGTFGRIYGKSPSATPVPLTTKKIQDELKVVPDIGGWVGDVEKWIERKSLVGLLYVVFTVGALALLLLALSRMTGASPSSVGAGAARRLRPKPGPGDPRYFDDLAME